MSISYNEAKYIVSKIPFPVYIVGSIRRDEKYSEDIDLLTYTKPEVIKSLSIVEPSYTKITKKSKIISGLLFGKYPVDIFIISPDNLPYALFHYTGPKSYNIRTRAYAKNNGLILNQYGIFDRKTGRRAYGSSKIKTEKDLTNYLGITYYPPDKRL